MQTTHSKGTISHVADGTYTVAFTRILNHPITKVWDAFTNPAQVALWLGAMELDQQVGGKFQLKFYDSDEYHMEGLVMQMEPPNLLVYSWVPTGMSANEITWKLKELSPNQTELSFSFSKVTERAIMAAAGWGLSLDYLAQVLDGTRTSFSWSKEEWDALHALYEEQPILKS
jgi:uncharacterized protein YndB with AHSA1/START domain